jgi:ADP-heptose:LPS heptosyltransferase
VTAAPHVLVARLDNAGDVLLAGPAVRAIATRAGRVTFLSGPAGHAAAELLPGVDEVISFDAPWVALDPPAFDRRAVDGLVHRLAELRIDEAAILTSFHQSPLPLALLLRMAGVGRIAATSVDHAGSLLDVRRRPGLDGSDQHDVHEVLRSLELVGMLGYELPPGDQGALAIRTIPPWHVFEEPYVVVHPGASVPARGWPAHRAASLTDLLVERGWRVAVTGGPSEAHITAAVAGTPRPEVVDLGGATDLPSLAGVLAGAAVVVSGNTGPAHLAAAVGTPVASIFAPVVPAERWKPWGVPAALLGDQAIACAGCRSTVCPFDDQPCLRDVTPEAVAAAVEALATGSSSGLHRDELVRGAMR